MCGNPNLSNTLYTSVTKKRLVEHISLVTHRRKNRGADEREVFYLAFLRVFFFNSMPKETDPPSWGDLKN
jgi:hypothetical protein